jgi:hypothetical protein
MVVIIWYLDLQLPVQSVSITTKVVSLNPIHGEVYLIQHYVIKFVNDMRQAIYSLTSNPSISNPFNPHLSYIALLLASTNTEKYN